MLKVKANFLIFLFFFSVTAYGTSPSGVAKDNSGWLIEAQPGPDYYPAAVANGEIGVTVGKEPFKLGAVIIGSAFEHGSARSVSHILEGINPIGLSLTIDGQALSDKDVISERQEINMSKAVHTTVLTLSKATVTYSVRALRNMPDVLMMRVFVTASEDVEMLFSNSHSFPSGFADRLDEKREVDTDDGKKIFLQRTSGSYNRGKDFIAASSLFICTQGCESYVSDNVPVKLKKGGKAAFTIVGSVCATSAFSDPWSESERQAIYVLQEGPGQIVRKHESLWSDLWQEDIVIEGDIEAQRCVRFALFNLYSSIREGSRRSVAPMGLTATGYNGHIFWDSEIWMFPALLALNPDLARQMLDYRFDRLHAARQRAETYGYAGAMFPWESDDKGEEATPTFALTGPLEYHITADIAIACWNYYCVTGDREWLRQEGFPILKEAAAFWTDRVKANSDGSYSICNVIGANEYAVGVTDNAFTNGSAKRALEYASKAAKVLGEKADSRWKEISDNLRLPEFPDGTTKEHSEYEGVMIKQVDANLLGYPLGLVTGKEELLKDISYYSERIDPKHGPAMSYSVMSIEYARIGMADKAYEMFNRAYKPNMRPPFGVFAETATSGNPYFMTGAGGLIQAVLYGFGGLEITDNGLVRHSTVLPQGWSDLVIKSKAIIKN